MIHSLNTDLINESIYEHLNFWKNLTTYKYPNTNPLTSGNSSIYECPFMAFSTSDNPSIRESIYEAYQF